MTELVNNYNMLQDANTKIDALTLENKSLIEHSEMLRTRINELEADAAQFITRNAHENQVHVLRRNHESDIATIGARLIAEANDRDWCSVYDAVVEDLNENLTIELPAREIDLEIWVTYSVRFRRTMKVPYGTDETDLADIAFDEDDPSLRDYDDESTAEWELTNAEFA